MGFRLETWLGVRWLRKKRSKRLKEYLRVTLSKNLKSVACTFWVGLYSFCPYCTFCAFHVKSRDILSLSFFPSFSFGGFYFLFSFIAAQFHACVVCIALPIGLAVVPTQGSYFVFVVFLFFRKQICFGSEG